MYNTKEYYCIDLVLYNKLINIKHSHVCMFKFFLITFLYVILMCDMYVCLYVLLSQHVLLMKKVCIFIHIFLLVFYVYNFIYRLFCLK